VRTQDVIGRLAGDEFIVVASSTATSAAAVSMGRRIGRALEQRFVIGEQTCFVSASVGVTTSHGREVGADQLIREADLAMYEAKRGVHGVVTYDERMQIVVDERAGLESRLRAALEHERLVLHYQPLVSLAAGAATGYEALIRWRGEDGKLIAPDRFIPLAQGSRLIVDIGDWVLHGACAQAAGWADGNATVSVNLGARELGQADALARVTDALKRSGLAPGRLVVELTESTLMSHQTLVAENLQALRRLGVGVAIDDFGTGYSSLSQLRRLPVSQLKIDQSFIAELDEDPVTRSVVEAIVTMAHAIGLTVVGEGVERRTQLDALRELGCDLAQGYLLGAPAPEPRRDPA
jgi:predicted signal transduction protein with EAL and GGDEF domain